MPKDLIAEYEAALARQHKAEGCAARHRAAAEKLKAKGQDRRAAVKMGEAARAEARAKANAQMVAKWAPSVGRGRVLRRQNELVAEARLARAAELAASTPQPVTLSPKEERKRAKEAEKRERLAVQGDAKAIRDRKAAQVDHDPRTAAGQREIEVRGPAVDKRASIKDLASLIARQTDRTPPRLAALQHFENLYHRAHAGLFPAPRFEQGVDTSRKPASVSNDRAVSLQALSAVEARLGADLYAVLFARVIEGRTIAAIAAERGADPEKLGAVFMFAVDAAVGHFGLNRRDAHEAA